MFGTPDALTSTMAESPLRPGVAIEFGAMAPLSGTGRDSVRSLDTLSRIEDQTSKPGSRLWFGGTRYD